MRKDEDWTEFINGDLDGVPIELDDEDEYMFDASEDPNFDFSQKTRNNRLHTSRPRNRSAHTKTI